ncbi:winged helix-turn-helix domain-containing protein [Rhizomonospora bruguierae]|uniref:winged helix-turn-helix domain-containing protein n=1 Tax=Rhizomonospora bruguierae TaxID=1581705 RepID=UPI001BCAB003|nr:winged helix-turn-helix domain-containing protein [Micromonospora sp. NBRC 107566]
MAAQLTSDFARSDRTAGPTNGSRQNISSWCRRHTAYGDAAVAAQRRVGRADPRPLTIQQELELVALLRSHYPDELGLDLSGTAPAAGLTVWTRPTVTALAQEKLGLRLTDRRLARILKSWGLGPRQPSDRCCPLCAYAVSRWLTHTYPRLLQDARTRGAQVCWSGRTRLGGVVPNAEVVSAVTTRGGLRFRISPERDAGPLLADFLARLRDHENRPVDVMIDGSWPLPEWPRQPPDGVRLIAMPSCDRFDP